MGDAEWVGHSNMANAHFGQSTCSGLWLLDANHGTSGLLDAVPNLATTACTSELMFTELLFYVPLQCNFS